MYDESAMASLFFTACNVTDPTTNHLYRPVSHLVANIANKAALVLNEQLFTRQPCYSFVFVIAIC